MSENSKCPICLHDIPRGAKKCTKCNSYLDWRRRLNISSSVLAMMVALLSVLTTLVLNFPEQKQSNISADYIRTDHHANPPQIIILVRNTGNSSGSFVTADLLIETDGVALDKISLHFQRFQVEGETGWYVGSNSGKSIFLIPNVKTEVDKFNNAIEDLVAESKCTLNFLIKPFRGDDKIDSIVIPCSDLKVNH